MPRNRSRALAKATLETAGPRTILGLLSGFSTKLTTAGARAPVKVTEVTAEAADKSSAVTTWIRRSPGSAV
jgi:hypothetical protein